jgi:hypothetical protein
MASSVMLRSVALVRTDVSEELSASFIRVTRIGELGTTLAVTSNRRTLRTIRSRHAVRHSTVPQVGGDLVFSSVQMDSWVLWAEGERTIQNYGVCLPSHQRKVFCYVSVYRPCVSHAWATLKELWRPFCGSLIVTGRRGTLAGKPRRYCCI